MSDSDLQTRLLDLFERTRSVDLRHFERGSSVAQLGALIGLVSAILDETREHIGDVARNLFQTSPGGGAPRIAPILRRGEDLGRSSDSSAEQLRHLCSGVLLDLRIASERLVAPTTSDLTPEAKEGLLTAVAACLSRIRKATTAVDQALAEVTGRQPLLAPTVELVELEGSLRARKEYVHYRRAVVGSGPPDLDDVADRLCRVAIAFMRLQVKSMYLDLRIGDRLELQRMHERVAAWVDGSRPYDLEEGLRVWQDCCGLAELLKQVNLRSELVEHDRQLIGQLTPEARALAEADPNTLPIPKTFLDQAKPLLGRDDALDTILLNTSSDAQQWLSCLEEVAARLR